MRRRFVVLLVFWVAFALKAQPSGFPAGIVLYADTPKGIFVLLADHASPSKRGWGAFGGHHESGESALETAIRETEEETRGYFHKEKLYPFLQSTTPFFDGKFAVFFAKVEQVSISDLHSTSIPAENPAFKERGPYAWIPFSVIEPFLTTSISDAAVAKIDAKLLPADRNTDWLWPVWLQNMSAARKANAIPWLKKTEQSAAANP